MATETNGFLSLIYRAAAGQWDEQQVIQELASTSKGSIALEELVETIRSVADSSQPTEVSRRIDRLVTLLIQSTGNKKLVGTLHLELARAWLIRARTGYTDGYDYANGHCRLARAFIPDDDPYFPTLESIEKSAQRHDLPVDPGAPVRNQAWHLAQAVMAVPDQTQYVREHLSEFDEQILTALQELAEAAEKQGQVELLHALSDLVQVVKTLSLERVQGYLITLVGETDVARAVTEWPEALGNKALAVLKHGWYKAEERKDTETAQGLKRLIEQVETLREERPLDAALADLLAADRQEVTLLVERMPFLQEVTTLQHLDELAEQSRTAGIGRIAERYRRCLVVLARVVCAQRGCRRSVAGWPAQVRACLVQRQRARLDTIITALHISGMQSVANLLHAFLNDQMERVEELALDVEAEFWASGQEEEALTIALMASDVRARLVDLFTMFPEGEQHLVFGAGLVACDKAILFASLLDDEPCKVFYLKTKARGLLHMHHPEEAEKAYRAAEDLCRRLWKAQPALYAPNLGEITDSLGIIYYDQGRLEEAETTLRFAEKIHRQLWEAQPSAYASELVNTLTNFGAVQCALKQFDAAEVVLGEAETLCRRLWQLQPELYTPKLARILNNLGNLFWEMQRPEAAETAYREAEALYRQLTLVQPKIHQRELAATLTNLGNLLRDLRRLKEAETVHYEAEQIRRKLWQEQPEVYISDLADTLNNLGVVLLDLRQFEAAEKALREAEILFHQLWKALPGVHAPKLVATLTNLGNLLSDLRRLEVAEKTYQEAEELCRNLVQVRPNVYLPELAKVLNNRGNILKDLHQLEAAEKAYREAEQIRRQLWHAQPQVYGVDLWRTLNNLGLVLDKLQRWDEAERAYHEAEKILRPLWKAQPEAHAPDLAATLVNQGAMLRDLYRLEAAEKAYREAEVLYSGLWQIEPEVYAPELATVLNNLGNMLCDLRQLDEAETAYRKAEQIRRQLWQAQPEVYAADLALTWNSLGILLRVSGRQNEAEMFYRNAEKVWRQLWQAQPDVYTVDLAMTLSNIGNVGLDLRRYQVAEKAYREAEELYRGLWRVQPKVYSPDLARTLTNLGSVLRGAGQLDAAEDLFLEALTLANNSISTGRWRALANLGRLQMDKRNWNASHASLSQSLNDVELLRRRLTSIADRRALQTIYVRAYGNMIETCLALDRSLEAWLWAERSRGRSLLDALGNLRPRLDTKEKQITYQEWKQIEQDLIAAESALGRVGQSEGEVGHRGGGAAHLLPTNEQVDSLLQRCNHLREMEAEKRRRVARLLGEGSQLIQVEIPQAKDLVSSLQMLVDTDQHVSTRRPLVVQFYQMDTKRYVVFLLPLWRLNESQSLETNLLTREIHLDNEELTKVLHLFINGLITARTGRIHHRGQTMGEISISEAPTERTEHGGVAPLFSTLPEAIGRACFWPWLEMLEELAPTELLLVPHGTLHVLPLHAAALPDGTLLFDRYPLVYMGSASLGQTLLTRRQEGVEHQHRLVMGPPGKDLEWAWHESQERANEWGTSVLGQPYAYEQMMLERLQEEGRKGLRCLHLSTHSIFNFKVFERSRIKFHDEDLTLFDLISDERFDFHGCRLVYLSSCESGLSDVGQGDELQGLVWSLIYSGARAVMASLWPVDDLAAYRMATRFYYHLHQEGCTLMEAYTKAMRFLREQWDVLGLESDSPYYWAPFVLYGDGWQRDPLHP